MKGFSFTCAACGKIHEGSPSFSYKSPDPYNALPAPDKEAIGTLNDDFCVITHPEQTDHFIRVILEIPIHGTEQPFLWGVWISVSAATFEKYDKHFKDDAYKDEYFGWLCNKLPCYPDTMSIKTSASVRPGGQRPRISLEPTDHPLSRDFQSGISWERAIEIAQRIMHPQ